MSTFDGEDLFGSGPHSITFESIEVDSWKKSFAGGMGTLHFTGGWRGRKGMIQGRLETNDINKLEERIDAIAAYIADGRAATLVDNFGRTFENVVLEPPLRFTKQVIRVRTGDGDIYIQEYELKITQIKK